MRRQPASDPPPPAITIDHRIPLALRMPASLLHRLDEIAASEHLTRTQVLLALVAAGLAIYEQHGLSHIQRADRE